MPQPRARESYRLAALPFVSAAPRGDPDNRHHLHITVAGYSPAAMRSGDKGDGRSMRVSVIGAGAVGLGLASSLLIAGARVRLIARREAQRLALAREGLRRSGIFGDVRIPADRFSLLGSSSELTTATDDYWLVCVKTTSTRALARELAPIWRQIAARDSAARAPAIVLCQNGWGNAETFAEVLPREAIWNARVITGFERSDENTVEITVHADAIHVGSLFGVEPNRIAPLCRAIDQGGIPCAPSDGIERDLFAKLLYNCLLNPLGALVGVPYGALGRRAEARAIMESVAEEIFAVLAASGRGTHWASAGEYLGTFYESLLPPTERHESSMLQDLRAGRATEIDALCGAVCDLAEQHGIETPVNAALATLVRAAETRAIGR